MITMALGRLGLAVAVTLPVAASAAAQALPPPPPEAGMVIQRNVDIKIDGAGSGSFGSWPGLSRSRTKR
jgi:hypothetical protein